MNMLASHAQIRASFLRWSLFLVPLCVLLGFLSGQMGAGADSAWFQALATTTTVATAAAALAPSDGLHASIEGRPRKE